MGGWWGNAWSQEKYNVLFLMVDDLRPQLGCYGDSIVKTPHIDQLAATGTVFNRAYCQMALCSPTRSSLLTGLRPDDIQVYDLTTHFREHAPDVVTLPQLFKNNGWYSQGLYKIFHLIPSEPKAFGNMNDPISWSTPLWVPSKSVYGPKGEKIRQQELAELAKTGKQMGYGTIPRGYALEAPDIPDGELADGETAEQAVKTLNALKDEPFFLAVGFYKPHLPFIAPKKYWDLYDRETLPLPDNQYAPEGAPKFAQASRYGQIQMYKDYKSLRGADDLTVPQQRELLHGYLACISYIDAQIGMILDELDRLKLRDKTIIVFLGDHGFQMGEHDTWASKHTNYETSTRAPLIVAKPKQKAPGVVSNRFVEFVDIYPTLADLCGLEAPASLRGESFAPLLDGADSRWTKDYALSQYPKRADGERVIGRSIRTERYRLVEWQFADSDRTVNELYDHTYDPDENHNVAVQAKYRKTLRKLQQQLNEEFSSSKNP